MEIKDGSPENQAIDVKRMVRYDFCDHFNRHFIVMDELSLSQTLPTENPDYGHRDGQWIIFCLR